MEIIPHSIPIPEIDVTDFLRQAAGDILAILQTPPSTTSLSLAAGDPTCNAIIKIAEILQRKTTPPTPSTTDLLAPTVAEENVAPTRVRKQKTPTKVSFNLNRNTFHQLHPRHPQQQQQLTSPLITLYQHYRG